MTPNQQRRNFERVIRVTWPRLTTNLSSNLVRGQRVLVVRPQPGPISNAQKNPACRRQIQRQLKIPFMKALVKMHHCQML